METDQDWSASSHPHRMESEVYNYKTKLWLLVSV